MRLITLLSLVLLVVLPLFLFIFMTFSMWAVFSRFIEELKRSRGPVEETRKAKLKRVIMFNILLFVPVIYGSIMIGVLISHSGDLTGIQERAVHFGTWLLGGSICSSIVAQGVLTTLSLNEYMGEKEPTPEEIREAFRKQKAAPFYARKDAFQELPNPYGKNVVILTIPNTIAIFGLLIFLIMISVSGVLGGDAGEAAETGEEFENQYGSSIDEDNIESVEASAWGFTGLAVLSISSGVLPRLKKGSVRDRKVFGWRVALSVIGTLPVVAGLVIMVLSMT